MKKLEVFDPPMCCNTGICGSSADPILVTFASDLEWLKTQGVDVVRYSLSLEPTEFSDNEIIKNILQKEGRGSLPILIYNDKLSSKSYYPPREKLSEICKIKFNEDEAPPIPREENCCCGVDCDCNHINTFQETPFEDTKCDCTNAPVETNCYCEREYYYSQSTIGSNFNRALIITILLIIIMLIALKLLL